jgi:heme exporter protein A
MMLEATDLAVMRGERLVLDGVGLRVEGGGALLLRGPNGSGKSTLLRVLAGLLKPVAGSVTLDGADVYADTAGHGRAVALLGHLDAVKPGLSCVENLGFQARVSGRSRAEIGTALERVALVGLAGLPARLLSSGQKRRLAIARLLLARGRMWLMDEPTTGLDDASVELLGGLIATHRAAGGAVVASTHLALPVADAAVLALG